MPWFIRLMLPSFETIKANGTHPLKLKLSLVLASTLVLSDDISVKERVKTKAEFTLRWRKGWLASSSFLKGKEWGTSSSAASGQAFSEIALNWLQGFGTSYWLQRMHDSSIRLITSHLRFWVAPLSRPSRKLSQNIFPIRKVHDW